MELDFAAEYDKLLCILSIPPSFEWYASIRIELHDRPIKVLRLIHSYCTRAVPEGEIEGVDGRVVLAGAMIAPISSLIATPFEMVKVQMQTDERAPKGSRAYRNSIHAT